MSTKDVDALLAFIKKAQAPKQAEIREKVRKEKMRLHSKYDVNPVAPYENIIQLVKVA